MAIDHDVIIPIITAATGAVGGGVAAWLRLRRGGAAIERTLDANIEQRWAALLDVANRNIERLQQEVLELRGCAAELSALKARVDMLTRGFAPHSGPVQIQVNREGVITDATDNVLALLGWRPIELHGKSLAMILPASMRTRHASVYKTAMAAENTEPLREEAIVGRALTRDGGEIHVMVSVQRTAEGCCATIAATQVPFNA